MVHTIWSTPSGGANQTIQVYIIRAQAFLAVHLPAAYRVIHNSRILLMNLQDPTQTSPLDVGYNAIGGVFNPPTPPPQMYLNNQH